MLIFIQNKLLTGGQSDFPLLRLIARILCYNSGIFIADAFTKLLIVHSKISFIYKCAFPAITPSYCRDNFQPREHFFLLFSCRKKKKNKNKTNQNNNKTSKQRNKSKFGCKIFGNTLTFLKGTSVFIVKFLPEVPSCSLKATWTQSLQTDLTLTPLCMSYPITLSPRDRLPFGTQTPQRRDWCSLWTKEEPSWVTLAEDSLGNE